LVDDKAASAKYAELFQKISSVLEEQERDAMVESTLGAAAASSLQHVRETSLWYAELLGSAGDVAAVGGSKAELLLHVKETWREKDETDTAAGPESAAVMIRRFQASIFQGDSDVSARVPEATSMLVPGDHFSMLHEPHVSTLALRLCHGLVEAGAGAAV
jgi:thioesterase domain-containing protein